LYESRREIIALARGAQTGQQREYMFHPILSETVFQIILAIGMVDDIQPFSPGGSIQPLSIDRCFRNGEHRKSLQLPESFGIYCKQIEWNVEYRKYNYYVLGAGGEGIHATSLDFNLC
jgi:hypothetical protein